MPGHFSFPHVSALVPQRFWRWTRTFHWSVGSTSGPLLSFSAIKAGPARQQTVRRARPAGSPWSKTPVGQGGMAGCSLGGLPKRASCGAGAGCRRRAHTHTRRAHTKGNDRPPYLCRVGRTAVCPRTLFQAAAGASRMQSTECCPGPLRFQQIAASPPVTAARALCPPFLSPLLQPPLPLDAPPITHLICEPCRLHAVGARPGQGPPFVRRSKHTARPVSISLGCAGISSTGTRNWHLPSDWASRQRQGASTNTQRAGEAGDAQVAAASVLSHATFPFRQPACTVLSRFRCPPYFSLAVLRCVSGVAFPSLVSWPPLPPLNDSIRLHRLHLANFCMLPLRSRHLFFVCASLPPSYEKIVGCSKSGSENDRGKFPPQRSPKGRPMQEGNRRETGGKRTRGNEVRRRAGGGTCLALKYSCGSLGGG